MRLPEIVRRELDAAGVPWEVEGGAKHFKLVVSGRVVGILPQGSGRDAGRDALNLRAQVRRALRQ